MFWFNKNPDWPVSSSVLPISQSATTRPSWGSSCPQFPIPGQRSGRRTEEKRTSQLDATGAATTFSKPSHILKRSGKNTLSTIRHKEATKAPTGNSHLNSPFNPVGFLVLGEHTKTKTNIKSVPKDVTEVWYLVLILLLVFRIDAARAASAAGPSAGAPHCGGHCNLATLGLYLTIFEWHGWRL